MTSKQTVSLINHPRTDNCGQAIYCPTTGDQGESALANLWTRDKSTSRYELHQAEYDGGRTDSLGRCDRALEDLLANRGTASRDVDRVIANDPQFILGHCLRAAIIVRATISPHGLN